MLMIRSILRQLRFGIAVAALIVAGSASYVWTFGPLFGVWSWSEVVLGGLFTAVCLMGGMEMLMAQPNPYDRSYALYDLRDVPRPTELESGGTGWMIQSIPSALAFVVLSAVFLIT